MFQYSPHYLVQEATAKLHNQQGSTNGQAWQALQVAQKLYHQARRRHRLGQIWSALTGRSRRLFDLAEVEAVCAIRGRHHAGIRAVPIRDIRGSVGRSGDFDQAFYPLNAHHKERWLGVATARQMGLALPAVELIQVGDIYFVSDGHHRISVAKTLGQREIDAVVTRWEVVGLLPWEQPTVAQDLIPIA